MNENTKDYAVALWNQVRMSHQCISVTVLFYAYIKWNFQRSSFQLENIQNRNYPVWKKNKRRKS